MSVKHAVRNTAEDRPMPGSQIVYVIDDNVDVRKSLHFAMQSAGITVWPFGSPADFLDALDGLSPAPILLDVRMPKMDGIELLRMIRDRSVDWPVIMMTAHGEIPIAVAAMKLGALDFLEKPFAIELLEELLTDAYDKVARAVITTEQRRNATDAFAKLSGRERQVALGLGSGRTNKEIAQDLGISPRTVEVHRASALKKLTVKSTADAIRLLIDAGEA
jgi:two-component system response regulator FixJ